MITKYHVMVEILFRRKGFLTIQNTFQIILNKLTTVLNLWQFIYLFQITGRMIVFIVQHNSFMVTDMCPLVVIYFVNISCHTYHVLGPHCINGSNYYNLYTGTAH